MFRRLVVSLAAIAAWCLLLAAPAIAQQRIAFVIGNAAYPKGPIAHSLADGGLVAEALTSIGFEIVEGADVNSGDFRRLFGEFLAKVNAAGPDAIAFIYYTGYAVQFEGDNYLIPVDAQLNRDSEIPIQGVRLFDLLASARGRAGNAQDRDPRRDACLAVPDRGRRDRARSWSHRSGSQSAGRVFVRARHRRADGQGP